MSQRITVFTITYSFTIFAIGRTFVDLIINTPQQSPPTYGYIVLLASHPFGDSIITIVQQQLPSSHGFAATFVVTTTV